MGPHALEDGEHGLDKIEFDQGVNLFGILIRINMHDLVPLPDHEGKNLLGVFWNQPGMEGLLETGERRGRLDTLFAQDFLQALPQALKRIFKSFGNNLDEDIFLKLRLEIGINGRLQFDNGCLKAAKSAPQFFPTCHSCVCLSACCLTIASTVPKSTTSILRNELAVF